MKEAATYSALEKKLKQRFGERFYGTDKSLPPVDFIRTGYPTLDRVLGGGLAKGRVYEVFGKESAGKTAFATTCIKAVQDRGGRCLFIDAEHALDVERTKAMGVNIDDLFIIEPVSAEEAIDASCLVTSDSSIDLVVLDSVAAMVPEAEYKADVEDNTVAPLARMLGRKVKQIATQCAQNDIIFIAINQVRDTIQGGKTTPGGQAFKFHASCRIEMSRAYPTWRIEESGELVGTIVTLENRKCKVGKPFEKGNISIYFGVNGTAGMDRMDDLITEGLKNGAIKQSGSWFYFGDIKALGKQALRTKLLPIETQFEEAVYEQTKSIQSNDSGGASEGSGEEDE